METQYSLFGKKIAYKWIVLSVTTIGALMASIDSTIVILGLPEMMVKLHADLISMIWVIMGYILVSTVFLLTFGRVADILGRVRMYNLGFVVFTVGSALCGFSNTATELIIFRLVQGSGAAMMVVNSVALITEVFPPNQRGRALGLNAITFSIGGVAGPILGGLILTLADWRWIFFINVPVGLFGALWGYRALKEMSTRRQGERFDVLGALSFSIGLTALLIALTLGIEYAFTSTPIVLLFVVFLIGVAFFLWWERRASNPVLDLSLFNNRIYNFSVLSAMIQSLALFAVNFLIVFYLQGVLGYDPLKAALLLIPLPIMTSIMAPLGGNVADRIGARVPATIGLLVQGAALIWFTRITPAMPYWQIGAGLALMGLGGGLFYPPNTSAAMNGAPKNRLGIASGTLATLRQAGMVTSFALSLAVAASSLPRDVMMQLFVGNNVTLGSAPMQAFVTGVHSAFFVSTFLVIVAAGISFVRGKEDRSKLAEEHAATVMGD
ncbi:MAG TPA: MFS transporter [Anaerolineales bacterium]|nr:MFS transporter [Anaerolineales bacterium]